MWWKRVKRKRSTSFEIFPMITLIKVERIIPAVKQINTETLLVLYWLLYPFC